MEKLSFIPTYWEGALREKIAKIHKHQIEAGQDGASIGFVTDMHWRENEKRSPALLERVLGECSIPYFFNGGDLVSGCGLCTPDELVRDMVEYRKYMAPIEHKCLFVEGNHDACYSTFPAPKYYWQNLSADVLYEYFFRFESMYPDRVISEDGRYYYVDDKAHKMRYIVLSSQDVPHSEHDENGKVIFNKMRCYGFLQKQIDWFANVALDVPDKEWHVVCCSHALVTCKIQPEEGEIRYNYDLMNGIINAFKKHTKFSGETSFENSLFNASVSVDFTGRGGVFVAWLGGHTHRDNIKVVDGIVNVSLMNDSCQNPNMAELPHVKITTNEQAVDIFTVNKKTKTVHVTRIGAGEDREFTYEVFE